MTAPLSSDLQEILETLAEEVSHHMLNISLSPDLTSTLIINAEKRATARLEAIIQSRERAAIEKAFPHLYREFCQFEDEMFNLEMSSDFGSFFRHSRVNDYLEATLSNNEGEVKRTGGSKFNPPKQERK